MAYRRRKNTAQYGVSLLMAIILVAIYFYGRATSTPDGDAAVELETVAAPVDVIATTTPVPTATSTATSATAAAPTPIVKPASPFLKPTVVAATPAQPLPTRTAPTVAPVAKPNRVIQQVSVQSPNRLPKTPELTIDGQVVTSVFEPTIVRVKDGDSLEVSNATGQAFELRLASIDAPEWNQPYGRVSRLHLQNLVAGKQVMAYQTDTDRYQRKVVYLFARDAINGKNYWEVNARMVADGYAWHAIKYSDNPKLAALQSKARAARIGLWEQSRPLEPWTYRDSK